MPRIPADKNITQPRTLLLATDNKNSVFAEVTEGKPNSIAYCAYGQQSAQHEVTTGLGFNGQLSEVHTGWYLLGNGYRAYNPVLMRFHSPDTWSPFGRGWLNAYMYCVGDPVNASDPTGHMPFLKKLFSRNAITRTDSTSSVVQLIPSTSPVANRRTAPLPPIPGQTALPNAGTPLDPSTGENIYGHLPAGRRSWTPPSTPAAPAEMMTFAEFSQQQSSAGRSSTPALASAPSFGPPVNRSVKPTNPATWNIPKQLQGRENADLNPATRPLPPPPPPEFGVDSKGLDWVDLGVYKADKESLVNYNSIIRKQT